MCVFLLLSDMYISPCPNRFRCKQWHCVMCNAMRCNVNIYANSFESKINAKQIKLRTLFAQRTAINRNFSHKTKNKEWLGKNSLDEMKYVVYTLDAFTEILYWSFDLFFFSLVALYWCLFLCSLLWSNSFCSFHPSTVDTDCFLSFPLFGYLFNGFVHSTLRSVNKPTPADSHSRSATVVCELAFNNKWTAWFWWSVCARVCMYSVHICNQRHEFHMSVSGFCSNKQWFSTTVVTTLYHPISVSHHFIGSANITRWCEIHTISQYIAEFFSKKIAICFKMMM